MGAEESVLMMLLECPSAQTPGHCQGDELRVGHEILTLVRNVYRRGIRRYFESWKQNSCRVV